LHLPPSNLHQYADRQIIDTHTISAGLHYPGLGPHHAQLDQNGRAEYRPITDSSAMEAFALLSRTEGIIPAIESAHAVAGALQVAREIGSGGTVLVTISGRGDKDMDTAMTYFHLDQPAGKART
jgi:tryptophan synthase beta chain